MLRYANTQYPDIMKSLKADAFTNMGRNFIDLMAEYGSNLLTDNREEVLNERSRIGSKIEQMTSNEIGYPTSASLNQPVVLPHMPMVPYTMRRHFMVPNHQNYNNYNYYMNYNKNYNKKPSSVQHINSNTKPHSGSSLVGKTTKPNNKNRRMDIIDSFHRKTATNETKNTEDTNIKPTEQPSPFNTLFWMLTEKSTTESTPTKSGLQNHKMEADMEIQPRNHRESRSSQDEDSSAFYVGPRQFPSTDDDIVQTYPPPTTDETSEPTINLSNNQDDYNDDIFNFETILLEGLGIDPRSIKKWSPAYCGKEYAIDVVKRVAQTMFLY